MKIFNSIGDLKVLNSLAISKMLHSPGIENFSHLFCDKTNGLCFKQAIVLSCTIFVFNNLTYYCCLIVTSNRYLCLLCVLSNLNSSLMVNISHSIALTHFDSISLSPINCFLLFVTSTDVPQLYFLHPDFLLFRWITVVLYVITYIKVRFENSSFLYS